MFEAGSYSLVLACRYNYHEKAAGVLGLGRLETKVVFYP